MQNQQERILINNWRRSAYVQQHILYPNTVFPNAAQYLPPATYDHQNHRALSGMPTVDNCSPIVYEKPTIFIDSAVPLNPYPNSHSPNITKSMMINPLVQQSAMTHIHGSSLQPIYNSELMNSQMNLLHPQYRENQCFNQQMASPSERDGSVSNIIDANKVLSKELSSNSQHKIDPAAFLSNRINDMAHSSFPTNQSNYNRHLNVSSSHTNYPSTVDQTEKFQFDEPFNKPLDASTSQFINKNPQYFYSNSPYSPIERENYARTTNPNYTAQFSEMRSNPNANVPSSETNHFNPQPMSETMSRFLSHHQQHENKPVQPSKYDTDIRDVHLNDGLNDYEKSSNHKINERHTDILSKDYYGHEKTMDQTNYPSRPDTLDVNKSNNTTATIDSNRMSSSSQLPQKSVTDFTFEDDSKLKLDDVSAKGQHENTTESIYSSIFKKDSNNCDNPSKINSSALEDPLKITSFRFDGQEKPPKSDEKIEKRRSSIDAGSFAKTLGYDTDSEKESIAANIRRRYSVAANFLNLQNPAPNLDAFNFTPTSTSTDEYRKTSENADNVSNRNKYDSGPIESKADANESAYDGDGNTLSGYDPGTIHSTRIEPNTERKVTTTHTDPVPISISNTPVSQFPSAVVDDAQLSQTPAFEENQQFNFDPNEDNTAYTPAYSTYAPDDQTYVENALEHLTLGNNDGQDGINEIQPKQYDDGVDKMRTHTTPHR